MMGQIFDRFGQLSFHNEAEVSQNFLIPLVTDFLGYRADEILPEYVFPAFDIPLNRDRAVSSSRMPVHIRPDFIVTIDREINVCVCDSKGPLEGLDDHLDQLIAYCLGLRANLLLITNGSELRVYNANDIVFRANDVQELDLSYAELHKLLNRTNCTRLSVTERLQSLNLPRSLNQDSVAVSEVTRRRIAIALSDFTDYLSVVSGEAEAVEFPTPIRQAFGVELQRFPAEGLYAFREFVTGDYQLAGGARVTYEVLSGNVPGPPIVLIGMSGIGKSSLIRQMLGDQARRCAALESEIVPVLVKLADYSSGTTLNQLIFECLHSRRASVSHEQILQLLRDGRLMLLFDAFDEVHEANVSDVEREVQALAQNYARCHILITTRHFRLPRLSTASRYEMLPLSVKGITAFAQMYLGASSAGFLEEIRRKNLATMASNTLLLTLMILLYKKEGAVPRRRGQILDTVIGHIRNWDQGKAERFASPLAWQARLSLLQTLAFFSLTERKAYELNLPDAVNAIEPAMRELEGRRQVSGGFTADQIFDDLAALGFVVKVGNKVEFWHRTLAEYFAAIEIAYLFDAGRSPISNLTKRPELEGVLALASSKVAHPSAYVQELLRRNLFTAARALAECAAPVDTVDRSVARALASKCYSVVRPIRKLAVDLLHDLQGDAVNAVIRDLLEGKYLDVQKSALIEIAQRKLPAAREVVYSRLTWDVPPAPTSFWEGWSSTAVLEALGEFDDEESQLHIIANWRRKPDIFTDASCHKALMKVVIRGSLSERVKDELVEFFLSDEEHHYHKLGHIAELLVALDDPSVIETLANNLTKLTDTRRIMGSYYASEVLASAREPSVVKGLVSRALDPSLPDHLRECLARAIATSRGVVPLDVFKAVSLDGNDRVKAWGIRGLMRYPFREVRDIVLHAVHPPPLDEMYETGFSYADVQAAAFEVLAHHDQLVLLMQEENRPEYFFSNSLEVLFEDVSSKRQISMLPLIEILVERLKDSRDLVKAAWVLAALGRTQRAIEVVEAQRKNGYGRDWVGHEIAEGIHNLPATYALEVIDEIFANVDKIEGGSSGYLTGLCIEALESIGTKEACDRLVEIAWATAEDATGIDTERALRALEFLAPRDREDWLINFIQVHPKSHALHRALEALGIIGTSKSLPTLHQYFDNQPDEHLQGFCYWAIQQIHERAGEL